MRGQHTRPGLTPRPPAPWARRRGHRDRPGRSRPHRTLAPRRGGDGRVALRDTALDRLGIDRSELPATTPAHYPCTRDWAAHLMARRIGGVQPAGLLWNSRVAELARGDSPLLHDLLDGPPSEACVLYDDGDGAMLSDAGGGFDDLLGPTQGRLPLDQIAEQLGAAIL